MKRFRSNGKLLLTGEYLVLDGALALAVPTVYGQTLKVSKAESKGIHWKSYDHVGNCWFESSFQLGTETANTLEKTLINILSEARKLNPAFLEKKRFGNSCGNYTGFYQRLGSGHFIHSREQHRAMGSCRSIQAPLEQFRRVVDMT